EQTVSGDGDTSRVWQVVQWRAVSRDSAGIPLCPGIQEVVVNVTVKDFVPVAGQGEAKLIAVIVKRLLPQAPDYDYVAPDAFHPPMEGEDAVGVVDVKDIDPLAAQGRMTPAEPGQFTGEAVVVLHHLLGPEAVPPDEGIVEKF